MFKFISYNILKRAKEWKNLNEKEKKNSVKKLYLDNGILCGCKR